MLRKFRNIPTEIDGLKFDSKGEARRWQELKLLERAGVISELKRQVRYDLDAHGKKICSLVADFEYIEAGQVVTEDFKSKATITPVFRLKAKLFKAKYGREVRLCTA